MFRLQTTMVLQSYPICFRIFCFCVSSCLWFFFCVSSVVICFTDASFFVFLCFLIRISIMTASCFFFAWLGFSSSFYDILRWFFLSQYHAIESVRVPILLVTNRYSVCGRSVCEQSAPQMRTNRTLLLVPSVVQVLFVCS